MRYLPCVLVWEAHKWEIRRTLGLEHWDKMDLSINFYHYNSKSRVKVVQTLVQCRKDRPLNKWCNISASQYYIHTSFFQISLLFKLPMWVSLSAHLSIPVHCLFFLLSFGRRLPKTYFIIKALLPFIGSPWRAWEQMGHLEEVFLLLLLWFYTDLSAFMFLQL